ncbi:Ger(x)C family spore germination protein [Paenibacillus sp. M1]|uniref:Ger(X)C family spore germination protein n=2 Tax=Paenibacillus TaxID=44249 RepID=A0A3P3TZY1_9BACL|nr:Ger(x)C family spore germination protein [Paenibacillus oralis]RRJ62939.1 Ger(x)C family spore germination protein [Paenibacillus oralis]
MKKGLTLMMMMICLSLFLSGCWSRRELNELAVASAIGIDKVGNRYQVSVQIVVPNEVASKKGGGYETPVAVYTTTAKTMAEAIRKMTTISPRKVYLAQLRVIVIGEELAREGISSALDFLIRDHEVREEDLFTLVGKEGSAGDIVKVLTHMDKIPADRIRGGLRTLDKYWAPTSVIKLDEISYDLLTHERQLAVTGTDIKGGKTGDEGTKKNVESVESPAILQFAETAVFRDDKLIGWLNEKESKGYNYITDRVEKTAGHFACPGGGTLAVDVIRTKTKIIGHFRNGKPSIEVDLRMEENVADVECTLDLTDPKTVDTLQEKGEAELQDIIKTALDKAQHEFKSDIFGFGEALHRSDPVAWRKIRKNWDEVYPDIPVKVETKVFIRNMGTIGNSIPEGQEG